MANPLPRLRGDKSVRTDRSRTARVDGPSEKTPAGHLMRRLPRVCLPPGRRMQLDRLAFLPVQRRPPRHVHARSEAHDPAIMDSHLKPARQLLLSFLRAATQFHKTPDVAGGIAKLGNGRSDSRLQSQVLARPRLPCPGGHFRKPPRTAVDDQSPTGGPCTRGAVRR